jgi:dGTPase
VVRLVDRVAYINHDLDDAVRAGIITPEDLPATEIELLGSTGARRIDTLARDIVEESRSAGDIVQSEEIGEAMMLLREFMFERVYLGAEARSEHERVQRTLRGLFDHYLEHPQEVPEGAAGQDDIQKITDYIAGMTDRFCIAAFKRIALPEESRL